MCDSFSHTVQWPLSPTLSVLCGILCPSEHNPSSHLSCFYEPVALHHICLSIIYIKGETGPSPQYLIALLVCWGKNWAEDARMTWVATVRVWREFQVGGKIRRELSFCVFYKGKEDTNFWGMHSLV